MAVKKLQINWIKCKINSKRVWCLFNDGTLNNLNNVYQGKNGVYIIWTGDEPSFNNIVYVGSGDFCERLKRHLDNSDCIREYKNLHFTAAIVNGNQMENVEAFLGHSLTPSCSDRFPDKTEIEVNLPF